MDYFQKCHYPRINLFSSLLSSPFCAHSHGLNLIKGRMLLPSSFLSFTKTILGSNVPAVAS